MYKTERRGTGTKKHASSKLDELAAHVSHWAETNMGRAANQVPTKDEVKTLLGNGVGSSMWQYILTHVSKPATAQLVRKNIQLHSGEVSGGKGTQLLNERAELSRELTSLRLAVTQLGSDLTRLKCDIAAHAGVRGVAEEKVKETKRKSSLLSAHSVKCQDFVNVLNEFSKRIRYRIQVLSHQSKEKSYFAKSGEGNDGALQLESACKRDVSGSCDRVRSLLLQLASEEGGATKEQNRQTKEQIWNKLESLLSTYSPLELMQCLCELTVEATEDIHTITADVNLNRDAKLLRYQCDHSGGLKDEVKRSNLLKSVQDHLMALQLSHINRSVECEQYLHSASTARGRLSQFKSQVEQCLSVLYQTDNEGADIARAVFAARLEVGGAEGTLSALTVVCGQLASVREKKREALRELQDKRQQIEQFTQIAEEKQSHIQSLVKANSTSWSTLQKQQNECDLYVRSKVLHHETDLLRLTTGLHDAVNFELQHFSQLSISRMMRTQGPLRTPVPDLTIHRLCNAHPNGLPHWAELLETMGVALYSSPECVLSRLSFLTHKVDDLRKLVEEKERALEEVKGCSTNSLTARGVLLASKRCDRQLVEVGVPALHNSLSSASQGLANCSAVQHTLQEWWDQPAQLCGHWITYDGMNFEHWLKQWRVLSAKLQRLSSSNHPKTLQNS